jgi:hypothetical protein
LSTLEERLGVTSVIVTYQPIKRTMILGPVFTDRENARSFVLAKGHGWSWVEVLLDDPTFAGYIV